MSLVLNDDPIASGTDWGSGETVAAVARNFESGDVARWELQEAVQGYNYAEVPDDGPGNVETRPESQRTSVSEVLKAARTDSLYAGSMPAQEAETDSIAADEELVNGEVKKEDQTQTPTISASAIAALAVVGVLWWLK